MAAAQFHFSDEQDQFRDMVRRFLVDTSPTTEVRRLMQTDTGYDAAVWRRLAQELGLTGLTIEEKYGGAGFGMVEVCIAMEEMGRALLCAPFLASSVLAANAIQMIAGEADAGRLLPSVASGELIATLAITEPDGHPGVDAIALTAQPAGDAFVLNGCKSFVLDGCSADLLLVAARSPGTMGSDGLSLFEVAPDAAGVTRRSLITLDPTRKQANIDFKNVDARLLGQLDMAGAGLERTLDIAAIALANEMAGGAARLLEDTLEYTKIRMQFGRSIASFQAIKHRCAEMLLQVELAKSAAYYAAEASDALHIDSAEATYLASLAKAGASEAYLHTAIEAIQLHGGIGFTFDQDTHLWFKRAKSSEVMFGDPTWHRERMMSELIVKERALRAQQAAQTGPPA
jgi:alkylation response protein AidB-like acyl-CoA dehydrogenase